MDASFIDECTVFVRAGDGGHGSVSFRREAHVPRGGPDGGDGGRGGAVVFIADHDVSSLLDLRRLPHRRAESGHHGSGMGKTGRDGDDLVIRVPVGSVVRDAHSGMVLADLVTDDQRYVAARGGRGGRGNSAFANRHRRLPTFAERGEQVAESQLSLELKLIADVGLVGLPSVGKSSLIRQLSAATPRVEAWPFTTLTPHLGVMRGGNTAHGDPIDVVLADVPGLVEGAADGRGLGLRFLKHIERCLVLLHVVDAAPMEAERDPLGDLAIIRDELRRHDPSLLDRPQVIALNKMDLPDGPAMAELIRSELGDAEVFEVSAVTGAGLEALRYRLGAIIAEQRRVSGPVRTEDVVDEEVLLRLTPRGPDFEVVRVEGGFQVSGARVERWVQMLPLEDRGAARYLQGRLRRAGVEKALISAGAREGDDVQIGEIVFEFEPELDDLPPDERAAVLAGEDDDDDDIASDVPDDPSAGDTPADHGGASADGDRPGATGNAESAGDAGVDDEARP